MVQYPDEESCLDDLSSLLPGPVNHCMDTIKALSEVEVDFVKRGAG